MNGQTPPERWVDKIKITASGCWQWTGYVAKDGYGRLSVGSIKAQLAHRVLYEHFNGLIPEGFVLDHRCHPGDNCQGGNECLHRRCVNPAHLEVVTRAENNRRGLAGWVNNAMSRRTHCPQGHPYDEENTFIDRGSRKCRTCVRERDRARGRAHRMVRDAHLDYVASLTDEHLRAGADHILFDHKGDPGIAGHWNGWHVTYPVEGIDTPIYPAPDDSTSRQITEDGPVGTPPPTPRAADDGPDINYWAAWSMW